MLFTLRRKYLYQTGFSLVELMVGMTIGFIVLVVIVQTMSVFESHRSHTSAAADAQVNGLTALMAIEADIRRSASGFNHPATFSCQNLYSYYQATSGTGAVGAVSSFAPFPVEIQDGGGSAPDTIIVRQGAGFLGAAPTWLTKDMTVNVSPIVLDVERVYDFRGAPATASDPPADLIMVTRVNEVLGIKTYPHCSLMQVSSVDINAKQLTIANGPSGKTPEYNPPLAYMTAANWPGFGTTGVNNVFRIQDFVFRVGSTRAGGVYSVSYSLDANKNLQSVASGSGAVASTNVMANEIVALQAQYGVSASKGSKTITQWVNPTGSTWGAAALSAASATAADNRQRIKAIRVAVVARSSQRDTGLVTNACADNNATNYGPCSWVDDTSANPAPVIDLRSSPGDTEWQHYRYRVYQTVVPMRNVLWPSL